MSRGSKRIGFGCKTCILSVFTFVVTCLYPYPFTVDYIDQNDHFVDHVDQHEELKPKLLAIVPLIAMNGHDVFVPKSKKDAFRSSHSSANDKAWVSNVATVSEEGSIDTKCVITWGGGGGVNSQCMLICQNSIVIRLLSSYYFLILCGHYPWTL